MGKGDKKSKRGKIVIGSSGVRRPRKRKRVTPVLNKDKNIAAGKPEPVVKAEIQVEKPIEITEISEAKAKTSRSKKKTEPEEPAAD